VKDKIIGSIGRGFNLLIGISRDDTYEDLKYIKDKVINLRVLEDEENKMNLSLLDIKGEILAISQFTLYGDCRKGRRPNFMNAMGGVEANNLYENFVEMLKESGLKDEVGEFGADMKVDIQNDGPVTILIDSKKEF
jgi:D-tyrosyl-tRNA(Tyr) deacylase